MREQRSIYTEIYICVCQSNIQPTETVNSWQNGQYSCIAVKNHPHPWWFIWWNINRTLYIETRHPQSSRQIRVSSRPAQHIKLSNLSARMSSCFDIRRFVAAKQAIREHFRTVQAISSACISLRAWNCHQTRSY